MIKNIVIGILGLVIIGGGMFFWISNSATQIKQQNANQVSNEANKDLSKKEVSKQNTNTSSNKKEPSKQANKNPNNTNNKPNKEDSSNNTNLNNDSSINGITTGGTKKIIGGGIKFNDDKDDKKQDSNLGNLSLQINANKITMNNVDITKTVTLKEGEIWTLSYTAVDTCGFSKMNILSQDSNHKTVELTMKNDNKFKTTFYKDNSGALRAKDNVNFTAKISNGNIVNATSLFIGYRRYVKNGKWYTSKNTILIYGKDKNKPDSDYCVDSFHKQ